MALGTAVFRQGSPEGMTAMTVSTAECKALTPEVVALVGNQTERMRQGRVEADGLRRFCQAIMDPDPRYWDEAFARDTRFGGIVTPALYSSHFGLKTPAGTLDRFGPAFAHDPDYDGSGVAAPTANTLPPIPTRLMRILNGGNEIEMLGYPRVGDEVFSRMRYAAIEGRVDKEGKDMLIVKIETIYTNQDEQVFCILRQTILRR